MKQLCCAQPKSAVSACVAGGPQGPDVHAKALDPCCSQFWMHESQALHLGSFPHAISCEQHAPAAH